MMRRKLWLGVLAVLLIGAILVLVLPPSDPLERASRQMKVGMPLAEVVDLTGPETFEDDYWVGEVLHKQHVWTTPDSSFAILTRDGRVVQWNFRRETIWTHVRQWLGL